MNNVFTALSRSVGQQIKYARPGEGFSNPTLKRAFEVLSLAGVIRKVPSANPEGLPLGASASSKIFKALTADIGLMQNLCVMHHNVHPA